MKKILITCCTVIGLSILSVGCATSTIFPTLTDQIAGVTGMAINADANRLYVVNANEKVAYNWEEGSFQVYDLANPLAPTLVGTVPTLSYSGKISLDTTRMTAYVPNRFSESDDDVIDQLYIFNIDEGSADFLTFTEVPTGRDPFGIQCCYPADRLWMAEGGKDDTYVSQFVDKDTLAVGDVNMLVTLDNGGEFTQNETTELAIIGQMGYFSRSRGGIVVVNLAEGGDPNAQPVDYWISDIDTPRGVGTDGTLLYVVTEEDDTGKWVPQVLVIDPSSLVPLTDNTDAVVLDKEDNGLLVAAVPLNERRDPQEVLVTQDYAFVSSGWNDDNFVHVIDRATNTWVTEIATGDEPFAMALFNPGGVDTYVYVANQIDNTIQVIDIATLTIVATYAGVQ